MTNTTTRFLFDSLEAATEALLLVLTDARVSKKFYRFGSLSASQVFASGLILTGDINDIVVIIEEVPGAQRFDE